MESNIQNIKIELIHWLESLEDKSTIDKVLKFKRNQSSESINEISEEEKESINKGLKDVEEGKVMPHSDVKKRYEKWL